MTPLLFINRILTFNLTVKLDKGKLIIVTSR